MTSTPHFRVPMRLLPNGDFSVVEQDTFEEVAQHAAAALRTPLGSRELRPDMGVEDTTHRLLPADGSSLAAEVVRDQLERFEPRAEAHAVASGVTVGEWLDQVDVDLTGVRGDA